MKYWPVALIPDALIPVPAIARRPARHITPIATPSPAWIARRGTAQMVAAGDDVLPPAPPGGIALRQTVRLSAAGDRRRLRSSDAFGQRPLALGAPPRALPATPGTALADAARDTAIPLTLSERADPLIPAGTELHSGPVPISIAPGTDVAVSLYLPDAPMSQTGQPGARATGFISAGSNVLNRAPPGAITTHWCIPSDVAVSGGAGRSGTVRPLVGNDYYPAGPATEAGRQAVNRFIRTSGTFDAVIDFGHVIRDPAHPDRLAHGCDSGDHRHPSVAGYRAMADAIPLALFGAGTSAPATRARDPRSAIAITFDDIPARGPLPPGQTRVGIIRAITTALARAGVPAFGFLNAGFGCGDATAPQAIAAWRAAGLPLGNHMYDNRDLGKVGAAAFAADVARNEAPPAAAAAGTDRHWFRYSFPSEGAATAWPR